MTNKAHGTRGVLLGIDTLVLYIGRRLVCIPTQLGTSRILGVESTARVVSVGVRGKLVRVVRRR